MVYNCTIEKDGDMFVVQFPDMPNIQTFGNTHEEALAMAEEALEGCLESDISRGLSIPPPAYKGGYSVPVASRIVLSLRLRELRGEQSQTDIARKLGLSYQSYQPHQWVSVGGECSEMAEAAFWAEPTPRRN